MIPHRLPVPVSTAHPCVLTCFLSLQHGADCIEEIPPLTLTGSKAAAVLAVSEPWLHQLEKVHQAEASTSSEAQSKSGSGRHLASGDAVLNWLCDWEPVLPCTQTLPGEMLAEVPASKHFEPV